MRETALITGVSGFCAGHLARRLRAQGGVRLLGTDISEHPPGGGLIDGYRRADVAVYDEMKEAVRWASPQWVFHLAGQTTGPPQTQYRTNLLGTINLLEAIREYATDARVLLVGSAAEYGPVEASQMPVSEEHPCRPTGANGLSKYAVTLAGLDYASRLGLKVIIARPFNIVGAGVPSSLIVGAVLARTKRALSGEGEPVIKVGRLDCQRDFVAVQDAVELYIRMVNGERWGEVFNVCSGRPTLIQDLVAEILCHSPRQVRVEFDSGLARPSDVDVSFGRWAKANQAFGYEPVTPLEEAIREAWMHEMEGGS